MDLAEAYRVLNVPFGAPIDQVYAWHRYHREGWNPEKYRNDPTMFQRAQQETARVDAALQMILASRGAGSYRDSPYPPPPHQPPPPGLVSWPGAPPLLGHQTPEHRRAGAGGMILGGAALFIVGLAITVGTYDNASREGGTYFVAYGPMIAGVVLFFQGIARSMRR